MKRKDFANAAVIRFENVGCVIWSPIFKRYYLLRRDFNDLLCTFLIENNFSVSKATEALPDLKAEFESIGVDDNTRIFDYRKKADRPIFVPLEIYFDFTSKCNLRCNGCYNINHLGNVSMTIDTIVNIIREMGELGIQRVYVAGGEPTIDMPELKAYIDTAYEYGITTSVATNGTLLSNEICEYLLSRDLIDISVSIDGWSEESNDLRRTSGYFDKAIQGVKELVKTKQKGDSKTEICVKPIIDRYQDLDFFEKMIELAIELQVDKLKLANPERSLNHPSGYYGRDVDKYYTTLSLISELQGKHMGKLAITKGTNPCTGFGTVGIEGLQGCIGGQELIAINADGRITPCLMNHTILGNYYDYGSMGSFYNSSVLDEFVKRINFSECHSCEIYSRCRGGCQVRKIVQCGETVGKDPICPINNHIEVDDVDIITDILTPIRVVHSL